MKHTWNPFDDLCFDLNGRVQCEDKQLPGIYRRDIVGEGMMIPPEVILEVESESAKIGFLGMAYCEVILVAIAILT